MYYEDILQKVKYLTNEVPEERNKVISRWQSQSKQSGALQHQLLVTENAKSRPADVRIVIADKNFIVMQAQATAGNLV
jgi:hypothetical protein